MEVVVGVRMGWRWLWGRGWDGGVCGGEDGVEVVVGVRMGWRCLWG